MMTATARLAGWRVLVPRGGEWGDRVAAALAVEGAEPVIAPLIRTDPLDTPALRVALAGLAAGRFDRIAVTSAAAAPLLRGAALAPGTRVAAVGPATAAALAAAGVRSDLVPESEYSARGMLDAWPAAPERVLILHSDLAAPTLADGLRARGHEVEAVVAYRTVALPLEPAARAALAGDGPRAALVTSGSAARALADQHGALPASLVIACLGPGTAEAARAAGLEVGLVAPERTAEALVDALAEFASSKELP